MASMLFLSSRSILTSSAWALFRLVCHCMVRVLLSPYVSADFFSTCSSCSIFSFCFEMDRSSTSFRAVRALTLSALSAKVSDTTFISDLRTFSPASMFFIASLYSFSP